MRNKRFRLNGNIYQRDTYKGIHWHFVDMDDGEKTPHIMTDKSYIKILNRRYFLYVRQEKLKRILQCD